MPKRSAGCLFALVPVGLLLVLGYLYLDVSVRDSYSGQWTSASTADARAQGVLLQEYVVSPHVLVFENYRAEFTDCWVEERTRTSHDFIFFRRVAKLGEPRLVLNYQGQRLAPDPDSAGEAMLVPGTEGTGRDLAENRYAADPNRLAYHQYVQYPSIRGMLSDSVGNDTLYFSVIRKWGDQRKFQIKAYPRK
ncbi:hypothetical protein ACFP2F_08480 [Hymenobacter artigasi]|uniref:Uncharacterized protein n=1 Tax=Hymenobacter artigasi TaxID=2719616 RepID=A0ABX1HHG5_9BACT|nr:hypothetical protein [Hymenobacter artigasi]NKI89290.1 hypothetical protein [Hymenobacter artigasi]